jgi:hypothetical protein
MNELINNNRKRVGETRHEKDNRCAHRHINTSYMKTRVCVCVYVFVCVCVCVYSRMTSGSHLMAVVLANQQAWDYTQVLYIVCV